MIELARRNLPYNFYTVNGHVKAVNRHCSVSTTKIRTEGPQLDYPLKQATVIAINVSLDN